MQNIFGTTFVYLLWTFFGILNNIIIYIYNNVKMSFYNKTHKAIQYSSALETWTKIYLASVYV